MADNESAIGAILEIPPQTLKNIEKAERGMWSLHDASLKTANQVYGDFSERMPRGIDVFIKKLADAKRSMEEIGTVNVNLDVKEVKPQIDSAVSAVRTGANDISEILQKAAQTGWEGLNKNRKPTWVEDYVNSIGGSLTTIRDVENAIKKLKKEQEAINISGKTAISGKLLSVQDYSDAIGYLKEYLRWLKETKDTKDRLANAESAKIAQKQDQEYLDRQKTAYKEIFDLRKQINAQKARIAEGGITQSSTIEKDKKDLSELQERLKIAGRAWNEYNTESRRGQLSDDGALKARTAQIAMQSKSLKEQRKYQDDLNKAIQTGNEYTSQAQAAKARISNTEEGRTQRQLNSDYKEMLKIIKEQGELKAKVAAEGRQMNQTEIDLISTLGRRYKIFYDDIKRVSGAYANIAQASAQAFSNDKSLQLARNAALLADAQAKAAKAKEKAKENAAKEAAKEAEKAQKAEERAAKAEERAAKAKEKAIAARTTQRQKQSEKDSSRIVNEREKAEKRVNDILAKRIELQQKITALNTKQSIAALSDPKAKLNFTDSANLAKYERQMNELESKLKSIGNLYPKLARDSESAFNTQKADMLALSLQRVAEMQTKAAAKEAEKNNKALHDVSPVLQAYNAINAQIERENNLLQQTRDKLVQANAAYSKFWSEHPDLDIGDAGKRLAELQQKISEIKIKAASQGQTKASITMSALKPLQAEYDALAQTLQRVSQLEQDIVTASNANMAAFNRHTPRIAAMREESDRLSKTIEQLASANEQFNKELKKGNTVKSLTSEYKSLIPVIERLGAEMKAFRDAGGDKDSASYQAMSAQLQAAVAREKQLRMMSINEIEEYRRQRAQAAYQADVSAFIQAEAQKKAVAQQTFNAQIEQAKIAGREYAQSFNGAMAQFNKMMSGNAKGGLALNLENIKRVLDDLQTAAGKLDILDPSDANKAKQLKSAIQELNRVITQYKDVTNAKPDKPIVSPQDAITAAQSARTLKELQDAYKQLKAVMATTDPKTDIWEQMNTVLGNTKDNIDEIRNAMGEFKSESVSTSGIVNQLRNQIAAAFSVQAITGFIKKVVDTRAQFELQNVALRAILQNKEEADRIFTQVQQMAMQSPFTIMHLNTYTKQLAAYRIETEKLLDTTKMLADVSAGLGVDMDRLILAYGQVKSANYLRATEVRQFTEAGLNISGELAQYFSELQGKMITAGDVMEMITKRMVRFEDVAEVFRRVTSEGGMFYDMQKKQAESLYGQVQRITDAISIMMNEIGQSNQTAISTILVLIRSLIQNWKIFVDILYSAAAAMTVYTIKTVNAALANGTFNTSAKGMVGVLAKVKVALSKMWDGLQKNPWLLAVGAIAAATAAIVDLVKETNKVRESYDRIIIGLGESSDKLNGIANKIEAAQSKIESTKEQMDNLTQGTKEYTDAATANKEAVTEQYRALQELRSKFPEVYAEITKTAEKTGDLTAAIREFEEVNRSASIITTLSKGDVHWYNDDIGKDFSDVSDSQNKYNAQLAKSEALLNAYFAKAEALYDTRKATGDLTADEEQKFQSILALSQSNLTVQEKIKKVTSEGYRFRSLWISALKDDVVNLDNAFRSIGGGKNAYISHFLRDDLAEAEKEADDFMQRILIAAGVTSTEMFKSLPDETKKSAKRAGEKVIKEIGLSLDEIQRDIIRRKIEIPLGIRFDFNKEVNDELSDMQKRINEYIDKHPRVNLAKIVNSQTEPDDFFKTVGQQEQQNYADAKKYAKSKARWDNELTNQQLANKEKVEAAERKAMLEYFGYIEKEKKTRRSAGSGKDTILELWKNRLKAVQDFYKRYEELQKNFSDSESLEKVKDAFTKLFKTLSMDMDTVVGKGMDKKGLAANIEGMLAAVRKVRPQLADEFEKAFADSKVQIDVEIQKEALDKIKNDMQAVADNFELSETFRKMGVTTDLTFMLGGEPTTLAGWRKKLEDNYKQLYLIEKEYGDEGVKAYEAELKKIAQLEQKNAVERAKNYVKYLTESLGERAQIEVKAMREIESIRTDETLDDFSKEQATLQKRKKMMEDLAKVDMENLKSSDVYITVFKDLENASKEQLQFVINKLRELQSTFKDLSPAQVRSLANDMKKLENAIADKESFSRVRADLKAVIDFQRNRNNLLREQTLLQGQLLDAQERESAIQTQLTNEQIRLNSIPNKASKEYKKQSDIVLQLQMQLQLIQSVIEKIERDLKETTDDIGDGEEATGRLKKLWDNVVEILNAASSLIGDLTKGLDDMGLMTEALADAFGSAQSIIGSVIKTGSGAIQAFTDPNPINKVTGAFQALGGVINIIGSAFAIGDKKKERKIKKLKEKVEDLGKAYENLHEAMEESYQFDDYNAGFKASMKNLDAQAKAYDEMIRLEESKKKTDKDKLKEYKEAREEVEKARKELRDARYEEFGSISQKDYQNEAESFVSAWLDAYKETGDGLDALTEHWDEFFENLVIKQAASSVVSKQMAKYIDEINAAIESGDTGLSLSQTFKEIGERFKSEMGLANDALKEFAEALGIQGGVGSFVLSDLQKGIQNITEPQAAAIEAYMNSIRFAVFRHTEQLDILIASIQAQYGVGTESPVVTELRGIRGVLDNIYSTLKSVTEGRTGRGVCVRVV